MPNAPSHEFSVIELRVTRIEQIFNSFDPSPFHERDLDADAEQFVMDWAREIPRRQPIAIRLCVPASVADSPDARAAPEAIANYFQNSAESAARQMREYFRLGWRYMGIGLAILAACLTASAAVSTMLPEGPAIQVLREGLIILGWVANWKPLEIFLYDWQPIKRRLTLYRRLAAAKIELAPV